MYVVTRFRAPETMATEEFRSRLEALLALLAGKPGFVDARIGRNIDDPALWVLATTWQNVGSYRRAITAYEVKVEHTTTMAHALDEPGAYEYVDLGTPLNHPVPRGTGYPGDRDPGTGSLG